MAVKNVYEVLEAFKKETNKAGRLKVLQENDSFALKQVLLGAFNPNIKFTLNEAPKFKREKIPVGMSYSHMTEALQRMYLFVEGNARVPAGLTEQRKKEILIQILESLEEPEADVFLGVLKKDLKVPYLTSALVNEAFPNLLPKS